VLFEQAKKYFINLAENSRLSHGYIFYGAGNDKKSFILSLANYLEKKFFNIEPRPLSDFFSIEPKGESVGIDFARGIKNFLYQKPAISSHRTAAIFQAELLTSEAQNALLKVSEDAPQSSLLLISVLNKENLLPTISSRLECVYLPDTVVFEEKAFSEKARGFASSFLKSHNAARFSVIRQLLETEKDEKKSPPNLLTDFLNSLVFELSKDVKKNSHPLKIVLEKISDFSEFNLNHRLHLECLAEELNG